ncbi:Vesicle membrane receptor protein (v-SNARE) [Coemansia interrupta]|uniref:Vesicle membrane receptor protein (V-SNARE) n=1 Tax=Coemansia interrupta TaxID=1126814 RepID=A0A9W8HA16_9FUNG|nr:Vesicle membrane receptor protein (v-SNARE) [Coemansia interrupta]
MRSEFYAHNAAGYSFSSTNVGQQGNGFSSNPYSNPSGASVDRHGDDVPSSGGGGRGDGRADDKYSRAKNQVDEVVGIMQENINKVMEREERLGDLRNKTQDLEGKSQVFRKGAKQAHNIMWWKNMKLTIAIAVIVVIIIVVIVVPVVVSKNK